MLASWHGVDVAFPVPSWRYVERMPGSCAVDWPRPRDHGTQMDHIPGCGTGFRRAERMGATQGMPPDTSNRKVTGRCPNAWN